MHTVNNFNPRSPHGERRKRGTHYPPRSHFNPRSPHGERPTPTPCFTPNALFQSTLPARGATARRSARRNPPWHFNPRSPHGERPRVRDAPTRAVVISIHAPRTGSDEPVPVPEKVAGISIHAPRTGSDAPSASIFSAIAYFNPRSPHGERRRGCGSRCRGTP